MFLTPSLLGEIFVQADRASVISTHPILTQISLRRRPIVAISTLAKSHAPADDDADDKLEEYGGVLIEDLSRIVEKVQQPKPPQPVSPIPTSDRRALGAGE